jgi:hypothetical protein
MQGVDHVLIHIMVSACCGLIVDETYAVAWDRDS